MRRKLQVTLAAGILAAATLLPAVPAGATHACAIDDESGNVRRLCESHPEYDLLYFVTCLLSKYC